MGVPSGVKWCRICTPGLRGCSCRVSRPWAIQFPAEMPGGGRFGIGGRVASSAVTSSTRGRFGDGDVVAEGSRTSRGMPQPRNRFQIFRHRHVHPNPIASGRNDLHDGTAANRLQRAFNSLIQIGRSRGSTAPGGSTGLGEGVDPPYGQRAAQQVVTFFFRDQCGNNRRPRPILSPLRPRGAHR